MDASRLALHVRRLVRSYTHLLRGIFFSAAVHANVGMYLPLVGVFTVQCSGTRKPLHRTYCSAAVPVIMGTYSRFLTLFTI